MERNTPLGRYGSSENLSYLAVVRAYEKEYDGCVTLSNNNALPFFNGIDWTRRMSSFDFHQGKQQFHSSKHHMGRKLGDRHIRNEKQYYFRFMYARLFTNKKVPYLRNIH